MTTLFQNNTSPVWLFMKVNKRPSLHYDSIFGSLWLMFDLHCKKKLWFHISRVLEVAVFLPVYVRKKIFCLYEHSSLSFLFAGCHFLTLSVLVFLDLTGKQREQYLQTRSQEYKTLRDQWKTEYINCEGFLTEEMRWESDTECSIVLFSKFLL